MDTGVDLAEVGVDVGVDMEEEEVQEAHSMPGAQGMESEVVGALSHPRAEAGQGDKVSSEDVCG